MSISIPFEKMTQALADDYQKVMQEPPGGVILLKDRYQALANMLIKHGIVSPPNHELLTRLESMAAQHACGCGHPACKRCADDKLNQEVIERAKGGAE